MSGDSTYRVSSILCTLHTIRLTISITRYTILDIHPTRLNEE